MTREAVKILDTGDTFPNPDVRLINDERMLVPQGLGIELISYLRKT